jgi:hypothetical protein
VKARGKGPLFYKPDTEHKEDDPLKPRTARPAVLRMELAAWVRKIGVADPGVSPNHSWRHLFKKLANKVSISERTSDVITGHAPATVGRRYGQADLDDMATALKTFPRYSIRS